MPTSSQARPLGVQISHMLKDRGTDVVFGIPGVHNQELYRGIEEAGITHILARNEQGAGFMADGYARASGFPGVCYVITGPGLCNIMNPMGQAYSDSIPMLVISSCLDETAATQGQLHQMKDQRAAAETVCDWSEEARTAKAAYQLIDRALMEFDIQRKRPKHIQVPIAALEATAPTYPEAKAVASAPSTHLGEELGQLVHDLCHAKRTIFILGGGIDTSGPSVGWITKLIERLGAVAFTTYAGRGVVSGNHKLCLGAYLGRGSSKEVIAAADLIVAVGTELSEVDLWRSELGYTGKFYRMDVDPAVLSDRHSADTQIMTDASAALLRLYITFCTPETTEWDYPRKHPDLPETLWSRAEIAASKEKWRSESDAERPNIVPLCDALREVVPEDTMFFSDMTQFAYVAKEVYPMELPGHWHHPSGFGTLGYALPAAIGGKIGAPEKPVISINGDSGVQYNIQELATAVELGLTLPIIVWDNGKLKEIEDSMVRAQIAPNSVVARNPDFCKLAEAYGAKSAAPRTIADFKAAVLSALKADGPTLIHITPETSKN